TTVTLSDVFFGGGSYVKLYEETGSTVSPPPGTPIGTRVTFAADVTVTMIRVHITDRDPLTPGKQPLDVTVSQAVSHADFTGVLCRAAQKVSGDALIAGATTPLVMASVGFVRIPETGGHGHQAIDAFRAPDSAIQ